MNLVLPLCFAIHAFCVMCYTEYQKDCRFFWFVLFNCCKCLIAFLFMDARSLHIFMLPVTILTTVISDRLYINRREYEGIDMTGNIEKQKWNHLIVQSKMFMISTIFATVLFNFIVLHIILNRYPFLKPYILISACVIFYFTGRKVFILIR